LPVQLGLLGSALPTALGRPAVGLLAGAAPGLDLLRVQAALAAVRAQFGFFSVAVSTTAANLSAALQPCGPVAPSGSSRPSCSRAWLRLHYSVASLMPSAAANSASGR